MRNRQPNGNAMSDAPREYCGVFGIFGDERAAEKTYLGLYALQHRGQESAGIAASDGHHVTAHKGMGLVSQVFTADVMARFTGRSAIGHNRYSTMGSSSLVNAQPIAINFKRGPLAAAHNGNLVNAAELRARMEEDGSIFPTPTDMCTSCFTGDYPTPVPAHFEKEQFSAERPTRLGEREGKP